MIQRQNTSALDCQKIERIKQKIRAAFNMRTGLGRRENHENEVNLSSNPTEYRSSEITISRWNQTLNQAIYKRLEQL